jgi:hypothetical protein
MLNADLVELPAGEVLETPDSAVNSRVYGTYVLSGGYVVSASDDPQYVGRAYPLTGSLVPNDVTCGAAVQAQGDTTWVCFSPNDDTQRTVNQMDVAGTATIPADTGFFVVSGTVQADGKTANQFQFFRPRAMDIEVQGSGTLILVR